MTTITLSSNPTVSSWETSTSTTAVASNIAGVTLKGTAAAAYLFGQALRTADGTFFGEAGQRRIAREAAAFEFPPDSGVRVSLNEVADALRYKFSCDPLIEWSADLGLVGYSLADINLVLQRLNAEYRGQFQLEPLSLREATETMAPLTELEGASSDLLLRDLMGATQRQALADFAQQLRTVAQTWLDSLGSPTDPLPTLLRTGLLQGGLALSTTSTVAVPGQTVSINTLISRAGQALGVDFLARFPDIFADGKLHLEDVNLLLAAAREADPALANDLADLVPTEGLIHAGVRYTGNQAMLLHSADVLSGLKLAATTTVQQIAWGDKVFADPFDSANSLSADDLIQRFASVGFNPFAYLGSPRPGHLTVMDINAFLQQVNSDLGLSAASAYVPLVALVDDKGQPVSQQQAYLDRLMAALGSAATSSALSGSWSATPYTAATPVLVGNLVPVNYVEQADNSLIDLAESLRRRISSPVVGRVYVRELYDYYAPPSKLAAFVWTGSAFQPVTQVNAMPFDASHLADIMVYWLENGIEFDGVNFGNNAVNLMDYGLPGAPAGSSGQALAASPLSLALPYQAALADGIFPVLTGDNPLTINGSRGMVIPATLTQIDATLRAIFLQDGMVWPPYPHAFNAPSVSSVSYVDSAGNTASTLLPGVSYKAVVTLSSPWPQSNIAAGVTNAANRGLIDGGGFLSNLNWAQKVALDPNLAGYVASMPYMDPIGITWRAGVDPGFTPGADLWSPVSGSNGLGFQASFTVTAATSIPASGAVLVDIQNSQWLRAVIPGGVVDYPITDQTLSQWQVSPQRFLGWSGALPQNQLLNSQALNTALFEYPSGSGTRVSLAALSQALSRDILGSPAGGPDLVNWFMGTGGAYSGSNRGWASGFSSVDSAAIGYLSVSGGSIPVVGLGTFTDPTGAKPLSEWSIKAALFSLWWAFEVTQAKGDHPAAPANTAALLPVASGPAQIGAVASAALTAEQTLGVVKLTGEQLSAFHQLSARRFGDDTVDELADLRRAFSDKPHAGQQLADLSGLSSSSLSRMVAAAAGIESGLLDSSVINRLAFGQRIGFEEPVFFDAQGEPASLSMLLGGRSSALTQRLLAVMPQLVDLGLTFDDLRRVLVTAAQAGTDSASVTLDDPARAVFVEDGSRYEGGAAVLLRIAAALRSLASGTYASVPLDASARVFDDPVNPGSGARWSVNDLSLLARRSAGYQGLSSRNVLYDTDLDAMVRQLELVAGKVSTVSLGSAAVSNEALAWFVNQLTLPSGLSSLALNIDATAAIFSSGGSTKSFMALLADVQRLFGAELAPRLEALGILQGGARVNVAALNRLITWADVRDAAVLSSAITISPAPTAGTQTLSVYQQDMSSSQVAVGDLRALLAPLAAWSPMPVAATTEQWRATQQRLTELYGRMGSAAINQLSLTQRTALLDLQTSALSPVSSTSLRTAIAGVVTDVRASVEELGRKMQAAMNALDVTSMDIGSVMGSWTFAADQSTVINTQRSLVADFNADQGAIKAAWQTMQIGTGGLVQPASVAVGSDGVRRSGTEASAVLLAQALQSMSTQSQALASIDLDAALFDDPAAWGSLALRQTLSPARGAPKISLRQLAARGEAALGINLLTDYAPAAGQPWTTARVNGVIQLINNALGFSASALYNTTSYPPVAVGTAQALRDKIVRSATQELVIPAALRSPLAALLNHVADLSTADINSTGFFSASAALFDSAPGVAMPDLTFNQLAQAGNGASPTLAELLARMGIVVAGQVNARGLNRLIDIGRAEMPGLVTVAPLALPAAVNAIAAQATMTLDDFESFASGNADKRQTLDEFQTLIDEWKSRDLNRLVAISEWQPWKDRILAVMDRADARGITLPLDRSKVNDLLALSEPLVAWSAPQAWFGTVKTRITAVIADVNQTIASAGTPPLPNYLANAVNSMKNRLLIPFTKALDSVNNLIALTDPQRVGGPLSLTDAIAAEKTRLSGVTVNWEGSWNLATNVLQVPAAGTGAALLTASGGGPWTTANPLSAGFDLLNWLHTFDMPTDFLSTIRIAPSSPYPADYDMGVWLNDYPGAQDYTDSMVGQQGPIAVFNAFEQALATGQAGLAINPALGQPAFGWQELAERLMLRSRTVDLPPGNQALWYQVAHALQEVDPADLPSNGSGAGEPLFEFPPGSGQRYTLATFRDKLNAQVAVEQDLPTVNRSANTALFNVINTGGSYNNIADALKAKIAELKANGSATGDVLYQLTGGLFADADVDRSLGATRTRALESTTPADQVGLLRGLLERNALTHTQMRGLVQEFLTRFKSIYAQIGVTENDKWLQVRSLLEGLQARPLSHVGITGNYSITELLGVATDGMFNRADVFWLSDPWATHPITTPANRTLLIEKLQGFLDQLPEPPASFDLFHNLSGSINFSSFTAVDRNRLLAAIGQALPDVAKTLVDWPEPELSAADRTTVSRWATAVKADLDALVSSPDVRTQAIRTEVELRDDLSRGAEIYVDRQGAFFINGVRTRPMDLAVTTRFIAQDKLASEYKVLMDEMSERNNLISAARSVIEALDTATGTDAQIRTTLFNKLYPLQTQLGASDLLSELTGAKYSIDDVARTGVSLSTLSTYLTSLKSRAQAIKSHYADQLTQANARKSYYTTYNLGSLYSSEITAINAKIANYTAHQSEAELAVDKCTQLLGSLASDTPENFIAELSNGTFDVSASGQSFSDTLAWLRRFDMDPALLQADPQSVTVQILGVDFTYAVDFSQPNLGITNNSTFTLVASTLTADYESAHFKATNIADWRSGTNGFTAAYQGSSVSYQDSQFALNNTPVNAVGATGRADIKSLLNTLISNKIRDGDMAQSKLQALTAQIQNNIEAMSALIKVFSESTKALAQALR